jgi:hypothetical protein|tara:strand:- start:5157 stop:7964 length:2808 start_codon:yes stop_codon:yes gene_type:complete
MFINKFDESREIFDLDKLKENFLLDEGEEGFYKLSLYQKKTFGNETINDNYNRPSIGPIENGFYCTFCGNEGPRDHSESCDFPDQNSLNLTISGINDYILNDRNYKGDYINFKTKFEESSLTQDDLNEILLNPDEIQVQDGKINIQTNKDVLTSVSYLGIYKKRGPQKLASKTSTTQFLNNMIISYEKNRQKTSIRISKNGLINMINVPLAAESLNNIITQLIERINNSGAINIEEFRISSGLNLDKYTFLKQFSYVHSVTGQFKIDAIQKDTEINFEELDNIISPFDPSGNVIESSFTSVERTPSGENVININGVKIIEWEYSLGRLTRNEVMTKEYIKSVSVPAAGIKLTSIFNKYGTVIMTLSRCSSKQMLKGLCGDVITSINDTYFSDFVSVFNDLFEKQSSILAKKSLGNVPGKLKSDFNTLTGYAPSGKICRLTRTREVDGVTYKEGMRPDPYTWSGKCPDPNYQYLKPDGVQDSDGLWYPCCEAKTKDSIEKMKRYLLNGFPLNRNEGEKFNIIDGEDLGSGIIEPGSNSEGASTELYINGKLEDVTIIKKLSKKSNEYLVRLQNGSTVKIKGTDFKRESRVFPGLRDFKREDLLSCIIKNLNKNNDSIDKDGKLIKNTNSDFNETFSEENYSYFISLVGETTKNYLTYYTIQDLKREEYILYKTPTDSFSFYLVLSPNGNFYISPNYNYIDSDISEKFDETIVLFGQLRFNNIEFKKEYIVMDLIYLEGSLKSREFNERYALLIDVQSDLLNKIVEEIITIPDFYTDLISGSYEIMQEPNKLVFIQKNCCNVISWGDSDIFENEITLQVLSKNRQTIKFGYDSRSFPENVGVSFFNEVAFNKRDIPDELVIGEYYRLRINIDTDGNIVPTRKVSFLYKTEKLGSYSDTIQKLSFKFSPIKKDFFDDPEEWYLPNETLKFDGERLIES